MLQLITLEILAFPANSKGPTSRERGQTDAAPVSLCLPPSWAVGAGSARAEPCHCALQVPLPAPVTQRMTNAQTEISTVHFIKGNVFQSRQVKCTVLCRDLFLLPLLLDMLLQGSVLRV